MLKCKNNRKINKPAESWSYTLGKQKHLLPSSDLHPAQFIQPFILSKSVKKKTGYPSICSIELLRSTLCFKGCSTYRLHFTNPVKNGFLFSFFLRLVTCLCCCDRHSTRMINKILLVIPQICIQIHSDLHQKQNPTHKHKKNDINYVKFHRYQF